MPNYLISRCLNLKPKSKYKVKTLALFSNTFNSRSLGISEFLPKLKMIFFEREKI